MVSKKKQDYAHITCPQDTLVVISLCKQRINLSLVDIKPRDYVGMNHFVCNALSLSLSLPGHLG
jgi:hypothetical protein